MNNQESKTCFVIGPIGHQGSDIRKRSDQVFKFIIEPIAKQCGYQTVLRADQLEKPGIITNHIIEMLINSDLVVADLYNHNPNVFYELAVRHMIKKPVVQIYGEGEPIPFDIHSVLGISLNHADLESVDECKRRLRSQIESVEQDPRLVDNPISMAVDLNAARGSDDPTHQLLLQIQGTFNEILRRLDRLSTRDAGHGRAAMDSVGTGVRSQQSPSTYGLDPDSPLLWLEAVMSQKGRS